MKSALEIAHEAQLRPISEIAAAAGILPEELEQSGLYRGKVRLSILDRLSSRPNAKLVIVTAITPTKAGEGKTTTSVALTMGLGKIGKKVMLCLREPSMGPVFGVKGGGTGGGYSQIGPMEDINLHFNGDFHAVTAAHNLLAAALDASIFNGNPLRIDPSSVIWPRTLDMNDRELRYTVVGLGGKTHGVPRENQFIITAASEVMAVFALSSSLSDLRRRLGRIVVASTYDGEPVTAEMLKVAGAMTVVMKDAIKPNIVQTLEGQPALVHAGPFGNIAHAANSIVADRIALKSADYVVTEAGFASDLGFQKFCDIVCRVGGFAPSAAVLVTTVRATKSHGGKPFNVLGNEDLDALAKGADNLAAHVQIVRQYGLPCVVAINSFPTDTARELALVRELALKAGAETVVMHSGFSEGGAGATELAKAVVDGVRQAEHVLFLTPTGTPARAADRGDRDQDLWRRRDRSRVAGAEGSREDREARSRPRAGVHGEDAPVAVARSVAAQPADRFHPARARPRAERRRRVRRRAVRRDAADAGPRQDAGVHEHRHRRRGTDGRAVLSPGIRDPGFGIRGSGIRRLDVPSSQGGFQTAVPRTLQQAKHGCGDECGHRRSQEQIERMHRVIEEPAEQCLAGRVWCVCDHRQPAARDGTLDHGHLEAVVEIRDERGQVRDQGVVVERRENRGADEQRCLGRGWRSPARSTRPAARRGRRGRRERIRRAAAS